VRRPCRKLAKQCAGNQLEAEIGTVKRGLSPPGEANMHRLAEIQRLGATVTSEHANKKCLDGNILDVTNELDANSKNMQSLNDQKQLLEVEQLQLSQTCSPSQCR
jgi:hypothetical protein